MEEKKDMIPEEEKAAEAQTPDKEKRTIFQKVKAMPAELKAKRAAKKAAKAEKPKGDLKQKIILGLGGAGLVLGTVLAMNEVRKHTGSEEVYDPDGGPEPGDWLPEDTEPEDESIEETSEEEVDEE